MDQISQIMNDPERMKQIMDVAETFGGFKTDAPEMVQSSIPAGIMQALHQVQEKEEKQQALVRALLPYLRPCHQKRLQRAIEIARLSHLAGAALHSKEDSPLRDVEVSHDV